MSINPVQSVTSTLAESGAGASQPARRAAAAASTKPQPDPGTSPNRELSTAQRAAPAAEIPQDEVEVQRDSATNGEIVIRYLDQRGNLILQVPSSEVLGVTRGIDQALEQSKRAQAAESGVTPRSKGGKNGH
ncbi:MAG TPA: hypothetical protein VMG31_12875 [Verrucomicrobiae bacterium]|nr:hypothetical protein [Verrucomicrobiae bacterium]